MNKDCFVCREMIASDEFTLDEVSDYHEGKLQIELDFTKRQRDILYDIFDKEEDETYPSYTTEEFAKVFKERHGELKDFFKE